MTWLTTFYLRAFVILAQVAQFYTTSDTYDNGPMLGFRQQPIDTLVNLSNQTVFCAVEGKKPLQVKWRKEEKTLDLSKLNYLKVSSEGTLTIFSANRKRDEGNYRCVAENQYGTLISESARVTFPYMNEFSVLDSKVSVNEGERLLLSCNAPDSYPDKHIYWSKSVSKTSSRPLQLEPSSHYSVNEEGDLFFSYVTADDQGVYYCSVENNNLRRVLKRTVVVSIKTVDTHKNVAPVVWVFNDRIAMLNSNFMLECIAYGRPVPEMKFRHKSSGIELKGSRQIGNRLRHEFGRFLFRHEGEYICEARNVYGEMDSDNAYIKMEAKPTLVSKSRTIEEAVDSTLNLPCLAHGKPEVQYVWLRNGKVLSNNLQRISIVKGNLNIYKANEEDEGFYQCVAFNRHGEVVMTIRLDIVEIAPGFGAKSVRPAVTTHALLGTTVELNCIPNGAPAPIVRWRKKSHSSNELLKDRRISVSAAGTLRIDRIKFSDAGQYECIASNKLGSAIQSGRLIVKSGLAIVEQLTKNDTVVVGGTITLTCKARSDESKEIVYNWFKGMRSHKRKLRNNKRTRIISDEINRQSILKITNASPADTGSYTCQVLGAKQRSDTRSQLIVVIGPNGPDAPDLATPSSGFKTTTTVDETKTTKYIIKGPPSAPPKVRITGKGKIITVEWFPSRDNGANITKYYIEARTKSNPNKWFVVHSTNKTNRLRLIETVQLSPWIEYQIQIRAENKLGKGKPSVASEWRTTPQDVPTKYPSNIKGYGTGPKEITVEFQSLKRIDENAPEIEYIVYYRERYSSFDMRQTTVEKGQNKTRLIFRDSDSYYKPYEFRVQARNAIGFGPMSKLHIAFTGERFPLIAPQNLQVTITSSTSANASWDDVDRSRQAIRGKFLGYKFIYWKKPIYGHPPIEQYTSTTSNSIQVALTPFTDYFFQVIAYNSAGDGPVEETIGPLRTPEGKPWKPANFKVIEAVKDQATLSWNEPLHTNGHILHYILKYRVLPFGRIHKKIITINERIILLKNLIPKAKYFFSLAAETSAGVGEAEEITFDFSKVPSVTAQQPRVVSIGFTAIVLSWTPLHSNITGYKVFYKSKFGAQTRAIALWERDTDIVVTIHGLQQNTEYSFEIAVVNKHGTGPRSAPIYARTKSKENPISAPKGGGKSSSSNLKFSNWVFVLVIITALLVPR